MDTFSGRIESLSVSHDLLVENDWRNVRLVDLISAQLAKINWKTGGRINIIGPAFNVKASAAQNIGLAIHELATNAVKYGALSNEKGTVLISWGVDTRPDPVMTLNWKEEGGPPVKQPVSTGFGNIVIKTMVESAVLGQTELKYLRDGFSWKLTAPFGMIAETPALFSLANCP
jgi:two-component sensor histidine kinase